MTNARRAGLYVIENTLTGGRYYGSTTQGFGVRRSTHLCELRAGKHGNQRLQRAWNKYGESAFVFRVLAVMEADDALEAEQRLLDLVVGVKECYNIARNAKACMKGRRHSEKSIRLMSERRRGKGLGRRSDEFYRQMSEARRGVPKDPKWARWKSESMREWWGGDTPERRHVKDKMKANLSARSGKKHSTATIEKRMSKIRGRKDRPEVVEANRRRAAEWWAADPARAAAMKARMAEGRARALAAKKAAKGAA